MSEDDRLKRRTKFVENYRHVVGGMVMDAVAGNTIGANGRTGFELSSWARDRFRQIDAELGKMFDQSIPAEVVPQTTTEADKAKLEAQKKKPNGGGS